MKINTCDSELACEAIHAACVKLLPLSVHVEDFGIGAYEFWGAPGVDIRLGLVADESEGKLLLEFDWWPTEGIQKFMADLAETFKILSVEHQDEHASIIGTFCLTLGTYTIFYQEELCCCEITFWWDASK